ncbi:MAG TPA: hypothetical protein VEU77_01345 [Candidatus Acidoferrales bacterium]|nr:hypothetical protein [Candidatus Acidoferrales bacterium]
MDLPTIVYALLAAALFVDLGIATRFLHPATRERRMQSLIWFLVGVLLMQILTIGGYRPELTGAFVIAAAIASSWAFLRKAVIRAHA